MRLDKLKVGNSAGFAKKLHHAEALAKLPITTAVLGAFTWKPLEGNSGEVYGEADRGGKLNRLGMPNFGLNGDLGELKEMIRVLKAAGKEVSVNFAGFTPEEYGDAAMAVYEVGADIGEANVGCPNTESSIVSYDEDELRKCLYRIGDKTPADFRLSVKLSPYPPTELGRVAKLLNHFASMATWSKRELRVVCSNTWPNAYAFKPGTLEPLLGGTGFGGYSGDGYKPIVLGQVKQFRELLDPNIGVTAAGDIQNGQDILEYQTVGADAFQIGNAFMWEEDGRVFERTFSRLV